MHPDNLDTLPLVVSGEMLLAARDRIEASWSVFLQGSSSPPPHNIRILGYFGCEVSGDRKDFLFLCQFVRINGNDKTRQDQILTRLKTMGLLVPDQHP